MADKRSPDDWKEFADDDLISRLVPDPNNPDVNVLICAMVGKGRDAKTVRLYSSLRLNQYIEVPADRILGVKRFPAGQIAVWIPGDLKVNVISTTTIPGEFLKGGIQSGYGRAGAGLGGLVSLMRAQGGGGTSWGGCPTDLPMDPSCPIPTTSSPPLCGPNPPSGCGC